MANNYLMFSEVFESVAPEEAAWVKRVLLDLDDLPDDELKIHQKWLDDQLFAPNAGRDAGWD
ncbi:MAG: hypothetical protein GTN93_17970, partial [Anaerolineae bacterium]|nr:hypothetical protein [Anaerolineae bacterium]